MGERSELFWLRAIASLAEVIASLSVSEAEQARQLVVDILPFKKLKYVSNIHTQAIASFLLS